MRNNRSKHWMDETIFQDRAFFYSRKTTSLNAAGVPVVISYLQINQVVQYEVCKIFWYNIPTNNSSTRFKFSIIWILLQVRIEDAAAYRCRVDFFNGPTRNVKIKLSLIGKFNLSNSDSYIVFWTQIFKGHIGFVPRSKTSDRKLFQITVKYLWVSVKK